MDTILGFSTAFVEYWKPGDDNDRGYDGPCGEVLEELLDHIDAENLDESDNIDLRPITFDREHGFFWNTHNALQVIIRDKDHDGSTYYIDNGYLGGSDNVFTQDEVGAWQDPPSPWIPPPGHGQGWGSAGAW